MNKPQLTFSVIVCVLNGERGIRQTLESLEAQDYPKDRYEIIVIDDGSTDGTAAIAQSFRHVRVVEHPENLGQSLSRHTGYKEAKGHYVAYTDADCIADPQWLSELELTLKAPGTLGAGGLIAPDSQRHLAQRYLVAKGYGRPASLSVSRPKSLWGRFKAYIKDELAHAGRSAQEESEVSEVYGANAAFPRQKIQNVNGFPGEIRTHEDAAICQRLRSHYPEQVIRFNPKAVIKHHFEERFSGFLKKVFGRQADNLAYHRLLRKQPPIFPFPLGILFLIALGSVWQWWLALILLLLLPPLTYIWWTITAAKQRRPEYLLYSYMQASEELARNLGLLAARIHLSRRPYLRTLVPSALLAGAIALTHAGRAPWLGLPIAAGIVLLPGYLLLQAMHAWEALGSYLKRLALATSLGVVLVMLFSLLAVVVAPLVGQEQSLRFAPLALSYAAGSGGLLLWALLPKDRHAPAWTGRGLRWSSLTAWLVLMAAALPTMAIIGANNLNNGGSNWLVISTLVLGAATLATAAWRARHLSQSVLALTLFSVSFSALLSYAMRSSFLFGWDIQQELQVFQQTQAAGQWVIGQHFNPYSAMLSLTTFPTALSTFSGLSDLVVFKVFFPALFSFVPVLLFYIYRMWTKRWLALTAAAVFVAQFYYVQEFSALARQQIAFLCFAGLLYLLLQKQVIGRTRIALIMLTVLGLVLSHYSTTYVTIALFGGAFVLAKVFGLIRQKRWLPSQLAPLWLVVFLMAAAALWYGPLTHSSRQLQALDGLSASSINSLWDKAGKQLGGNKQQPAALPYLQHIAKEYHNEKQYFNFYPDADNHTIKTVKQSAAHGRLGFLAPVVDGLDGLLRIAWWGLGALGIIWFAARLFNPERFAYRNVEAAMLVLMALGAFLLIHAFPEIGKYYNASRINQQALMVVSLPAVVLLGWLLRRYAARWERGAIITAVGLSFLIATGVAGQLTGSRLQANLNNSSDDYQRFYIHSSEVAAARWLDAHRQPQDVIYADRYASLRFTVPTDIFYNVMPDITPETLDKSAYVFADQTNHLDGVTMASYRGETVTFEFPKAFLDSHKNKLYSNGYAEVYK